MKKESWFIRLIRYLFYPNNGVRTSYQEQIIEQLRLEKEKRFAETLYPQAKVSEIGKQLVKKNQRLTGKKK